MKHVLKNERGMALALAIVALAVVGALIAGALFSGTQEQRAGENMRRALASFGVAEEGVYDVIRGWDNNRATYAGLYPYPANGPARDSVLIDTTTSASKTGFRISSPNCSTVRRCGHGSMAARFRRAARSTMQLRSRGVSRPRTKKESSIATSSPKTFSSPKTGG